MPITTMMGALFHYITHADPRQFQPMKANFGLMPPLDESAPAKGGRHAAYVERSLAALEELLRTEPALTVRRQS